MIKTKYILNKECTLDLLEEEGFRFNYGMERWIRLYPVLFYQGKQHTPVVFLKAVIDLEEHDFSYSIVNGQGDLDSMYYSDYGRKDTYVTKIDKNVTKVLRRLCFAEIIEKRRR